MLDYSNRKNNIIIAFIIGALLLVGKLAYMQLIDDTYQERAKKTTLFRNTLYPARGLIVDRNEKLMVTNIPIYEINAVYKEIDPKMDTMEFCQLLGIDKATFIANLNKDWSKPQFHKSVPFTFLTRIRPEQYAFFKEHLYKFRGFYPVLKNIRAYPHKNAAHILGYLGEVNQNTIDASNGEYTLGDYMGITGIERALEKELKGSKGIRYLLKDNLGREVGPFKDGTLDSMAVSGIDMMSSIDLDLQTYGEELLQNKRGAIVAIDPATGEILAMVSAPSYDPSLIALDRNRSKAFDSLMTDKVNLPFFNRTIMGQYPPGSIFKTVMSLIALEKGITYPSRYIPCDGYYELDRSGRSYQKCHIHPHVNSISAALQYSCNSYYYQICRELVNQYGYKDPSRGLDTLVSYIKDFGLGEKLGVENLSEDSGFIPTSQYYDKLYKSGHNGWRATYMLSLGIGQGELQVTTLQMANLAAIIANRGFFYKPHLIKKYLHTKLDIDPAFKEKHKVRIAAKHFPPVIHGMEMAVMAGTAKSAYLPGLDVCGKTGTSQNPFGEDHSVFFGFAPRDNPKIAIAVFIENAGWGASYATPIAGLMIEKYINRLIPEARKGVEEKMKKAALLYGLPKPGVAKKPTAEKVDTSEFVE